MSENNEILLGVALLERTIPLLNIGTRVMISKSSIQIIQKSLHHCVIKINPYCQDTLILLPLLEISEMIDLMLSDTGFKECDDETKDLIIQRITSALTRLYLFAGKFYIDNEFTYSLGLSKLLQNIIKSCIAQGFYFGYDKILMEEGAI